MSFFPRKTQVARLVKAYKELDKGFATSDEDQRKAEAVLKRVRQNSSKKEIEEAHRQYKKDTGYAPRLTPKSW
jgi:hypothetical protein